MSVSNSAVLPILPTDRWKENPMETGHCGSVFLNIFLTVTLCYFACGDLTIVKGEIVCELTELLLPFKCAYPLHSLLPLTNNVQGNAAKHVYHSVRDSCFNNYFLVYVNH